MSVRMYLCLYFLSVCMHGVHVKNYRHAFSRDAALSSSGGFGPTDSMYCAYCRQRGWHSCIKRYCNRGAAFSVAGRPSLNTGYYMPSGYGPDWTTGYYMPAGYGQDWTTGYYMPGKYRSG